MERAVERLLAAEHKELWPDGAPTPGWLRVERTTTQRASDVVAFLNAGGGGWVQHAGAVCVLDAGVSVAEAREVGHDPSKPRRERGQVLSAERVLREGGGELESCSVRWLDGAWGCWRYTLGQGAAPEGATRVLVFKEEYASTEAGTGGRRMQYRVCWRAVEQSGVSVWRPWVGIFAGWEGEGR